jgi:GYF domain 2
VTYRIARDGEIYGPYSTAEVLRHMAAGAIVPTDLAQGEGQQEWLRVETLFPAAPAPQPMHPGGMPKLFPDPPDLPWWIALLIGAFTLGFFFQIWDIVQSAWMKRVDRNSIAVFLYIAEFVVFLMKLPSTLHNVAHNFGAATYMETPSRWLIITGVILLLASRFVLRSELLKHFNGPEPIGLRLNWLWTLLFGGLYFQYEFNCINQVKRTLHISVPAA